MNAELDTPAFDREALAKAIFRMDTRLQSIDGSVGGAQQDLADLRGDFDILKDIALDLRGHLAARQAAPADSDLARQLRHIKWAVVVIALALLLMLLRVFG